MQATSDQELRTLDESSEQHSAKVYQCALAHCLEQFNSSEEAERHSVSVHGVDWFLVSGRNPNTPTPTVQVKQEPEEPEDVEVDSFPSTPVTPCNSDGFTAAVSTPPRIKVEPLASPETAEVCTKIKKEAVEIQDDFELSDLNLNVLFGLEDIRVNMLPHSPKEYKRAGPSINHFYPNGRPAAKNGHQEAREESDGEIDDSGGSGEEDGACAEEHGEPRGLQRIKEEKAEDGDNWSSRNEEAPDNGGYRTSNTFEFISKGGSGSGQDGEMMNVKKEYPCSDEPSGEAPIEETTRDRPESRILPRFKMFADSMGAIVKQSIQEGKIDIRASSDINHNKIESDESKEERSYYRKKKMDSPHPLHLKSRLTREDEGHNRRQEKSGGRKCLADRLRDLSKSNMSEKATSISKDNQRFKMAAKNAWKKKKDRKDQHDSLKEKSKFNPIGFKMMHQASTLTKPPLPSSSKQMTDSVGYVPLAGMMKAKMPDQSRAITESNPTSLDKELQNTENHQVLPSGLPKIGVAIDVNANTSGPNLRQFPAANPFASVAARPLPTFGTAAAESLLKKRKRSDVPSLDNSPRSSDPDSEDQPCKDSKEKNAAECKLVKEEESNDSVDYSIPNGWDKLKEENKEKPKKKKKIKKPKKFVDYDKNYVRQEQTQYIEEPATDSEEEDDFAKELELYKISRDVFGAPKDDPAEDVFGAPKDDPERRKDALQNSAEKAHKKIHTQREREETQIEGQKDRPGDKKDDGEEDGKSNKKNQDLTQYDPNAELDDELERYFRDNQQLHTPQLTPGKRQIKREADDEACRQEREHDQQEASDVTSSDVTSSDVTFKCIVKDCGATFSQTHACERHLQRAHGVSYNIFRESHQILGDGKLGSFDSANDGRRHKDRHLNKEHTPSPRQKSSHQRGRENDRVGRKGEKHNGRSRSQDNIGEHCRQTGITRAEYKSPRSERKQHSRRRHHHYDHVKR